MSSTETTTGKNTSNKPAFPLPPELRVKVYEQLLIHTNRALLPNGIPRYTGSRTYREKDYIFTSILRTCRTFYQEALSILYGKNTLAFHDNDFSKPVLPFLKGHLIMVKYVEVDISPIMYSSARKMGQFLETLGTSGADLLDLTIRIHMLQMSDEVLREHHDALTPLHLVDQCLIGDHPIVGALFSLKAVKKLYIELEDEARFEPGVADALKNAFMVEGTADGCSLTIEKGCTFPHEEMHEGKSCPGCKNKENDLVNGTADWKYKDDALTSRALITFLCLGGELLKNGKSPWANSKIETVAKAKQDKAKAAAKKPAKKAKQTKVKPAEFSSKKTAGHE